VLTLALPAATATPVGSVPGTRHVVWQVAAWELHSIMQLVTVDVCASRILAAAAALTNPSVAELIDSIANRIASRCMDASLVPRGIIITPRRRPGNAAATPLERHCGTTDRYAVRM
jgi:hypothetical protein